MLDNTPKRVLIVDDEPHVTIILSESLAKANKGYIIETASNGQEALDKIQQQTYDLVLTDYKMPQMDGLELATSIHHVSPETQVVLMTAYGTQQLRDRTTHLQLAGYLDKPFTAAQIREVVERILERTHPTQSPPAAVPALGEEVSVRLQTLQADTGARCVLLLSAAGYPVDTVGYTTGLDLPSLSALIAANFAAAAELARMLGNSSIFKSSYHEGPDYNVYSYEVNKDFLLAVIFGAESKVGAVWLYAKQTATALVPLLSAQPSTTRISDDMAMAIDAEMDRLFATDDHTDTEDQENQLMSIEEAIAAGLLPADMFEASE